MWGCDKWSRLREGSVGAARRRVARGHSMTTTTKKVLIDRIAELTGQKRPVVREIVQLFLDQMVEELRRGNRLEFRDFGIFEVKTRAARRAQNPKTLERVEVPPKRTVKFKVGRLLREGLDQQSSQAPAMVEAKPKRSRAAARAV
ncbi:MAG: hypothetical protein AMXMBFR58_12280 [Phycisphaerae bacterium]|nr:Integration host factor subunit beta [Phycisphaerales bacterium]